MPPQGVAAVERALSLIACFQVGETSLTLQTLAKRSKLKKSTIIRLANSLLAYGYLLKVGPGEYSLGPSLLRYGAMYQASLHHSDHILPALKQLVAATHQTAAFFVRDGNLRICMHMVESDSVLRLHLKEGSFQPLLPGGSGEVLLAYSDDDAEALPFTGIRRNGIAVNIGGRHPEISSVAAPVFQHDGSLLGAITVSGPTRDYTKKKISVFKDCLVATARQITERLGGSYSR